MALTDPKDCLAYHQSRVLMTYRDMSPMSCQKVVAAMKAFVATDKQKKIESPKLR